MWRGNRGVQKQRNRLASELTTPCWTLRDLQDTARFQWILYSILGMSALELYPPDFYASTPCDQPKRHYDDTLWNLSSCLFWGLIRRRFLSKLHSSVHPVRVCLCHRISKGAGQSARLNRRQCTNERWLFSVLQYSAKLEFPFFLCLTDRMDVALFRHKNTILQRRVLHCKPSARVISDVWNRPFTLIKREDDTRNLNNFLVYFSHNAMLT
jgi:hypothetical protein